MENGKLFQTTLSHIKIQLHERNMEENSRKREKSNGVQNVDRGSENSYRQKEMERHSKKPYAPSGVRN